MTSKAIDDNTENNI